MIESDLMNYNNVRIFANKFILCKCGYIVAVFLFFAVILFNSVTAFALNEDYLDESKWADSNNVTSLGLDKKSFDHKLNGVFKYYIDSSNGDIYLYFSITESSLDVNSDDVKININIKSNTENYIFSIDKHGMCDAQNEEYKLFSVQQNFGYYDSTDGGLYIAGVHADNYEQLILGIKLYINGHIYKIIDNIIVQKPEEIKSEKSVKTTSAAVKSGKASASNKSEQSSNNIGSTVGSTKFSGEPVATESTSHTEDVSYFESAQTSNNGSDSYNTSVAENEQAKKSSISETAKRWLSIGAAVGAVGFILLTAAVITQKSEKNKPKSDDDN
ncbi:MAG: hypothetical protein ACLUFN_05125 [Eubacterium sp.]